MVTKLTEKDIKRILYGATFLGGGGGGPLETAVEILEKLVAQNKNVEVCMRALDDPEVDPKGYGAMIACLGSPEAMKAGTFGPDGVASFEAFKKALAPEGKEVKYLYSGEMGGFNTFAPMLVAIYSSDKPEERIEFLDVDANGRAVPELNTSLNAARGFPPRPVGMGSLNLSTPGGTCNEIVAYTENDVEAERIARGICGVYNNQIGFSTWAMCKDEFLANAVNHGVSKALAVGEALEKAAATQSADPSAFLQVATECSLFGRGKIIKKETRIIGGFDCGTTTIKIPDGERAGIYTIDFQNENLVMRRSDGTAVITVPEIITMICMDQGMRAYPLTNASTAEGMEIELYTAPADEKWWSDDFHANLVWMDCLKRVGYDGKQVRHQKFS